jgi:hypothetical protein
LFFPDWNRQSQLALIAIQQPQHYENKNCAVKLRGGSCRALPNSSATHPILTAQR